MLSGDFLGNFWSLGSYDKKIRQKSALALLENMGKDCGISSCSFATKDKTNKIVLPDKSDMLLSTNLEYTLTRLINGLGSDREASRVGYATLITSLLDKYTSLIPLTTIAEAIKTTTATAGKNAGEIKDTYIGRVLGYSILQRVGFFKSKKCQTQLQEVVLSLIEVLDSKSYLQDLTSIVLSQIIVDSESVMPNIGLKLIIKRIKGVFDAHKSQSTIKCYGSLCLHIQLLRRFKPIESLPPSPPLNKHLKTIVSSLLHTNFVACTAPNPSIVWFDLCCLIMENSTLGTFEEFLSLVFKGCFSKDCATIHGVYVGFRVAVEILSAIKSNPDRDTYANLFWQNSELYLDQLTYHINPHSRTPLYESATISIAVVDFICNNKRSSKPGMNALFDGIYHNAFALGADVEVLESSRIKLSSDSALFLLTKFGSTLQSVALPQSLIKNVTSLTVPFLDETQKSLLLENSANQSWFLKIALESCDLPEDLDDFCVIVARLVRSGLLISNSNVLSRFCSSISNVFQLLLKSINVSEESPSEYGVQATKFRDFVRAIITGLADHPSLTFEEAYQLLGTVNDESLQNAVGQEIDVLVRNLATSFGFLMDHILSKLILKILKGKPSNFLLLKQLYKGIAHYSVFIFQIYTFAGAQEYKSEIYDAYQLIRQLVDNVIEPAVKHRKIKAEVIQESIVSISDVLLDILGCTQQASRVEIAMGMVSSVMQCSWAELSLFASPETIQDLLKAVLTDEDPNAPSKEGTDDEDDESTSQGESSVNDDNNESDFERGTPTEAPANPEEDLEDENDNKGGVLDNLQDILGGASPKSQLKMEARKKMQTLVNKKLRYIELLCTHYTSKYSGNHRPNDLLNDIDVLVRVFVKARNELVHCNAKTQSKGVKKLKDILCLKLVKCVKHLTLLFHGAIGHIASPLEESLKEKMIISLESAYDHLNSTMKKSIHDLQTKSKCETLASSVIFLLLRLEEVIFPKRCNDLVSTKFLVSLLENWVFKPHPVVTERFFRSLLTEWNSFAKQEKLLSFLLLPFGKISAKSVKFFVMREALSIQGQILASFHKATRKVGQFNKQLRVPFFPTANSVEDILLSLAKDHIVMCNTESTNVKRAMASKEEDEDEPSKRYKINTSQFKTFNSQLRSSLQITSNIVGKLEETR